MLLKSIYEAKTMSSLTQIVTSGAGTANPAGTSPVLSGVRVAQSLVFCVLFCRSLFVFLNFDLWRLITSLTSSKFS